MRPLPPAGASRLGEADEGVGGSAGRKGDAAFARADLGAEGGDADPAGRDVGEPEAAVARLDSCRRLTPVLEEADIAVDVVVRVAPVRRR